MEFNSNKLSKKTLSKLIEIQENYDVSGYSSGGVEGRLKSAGSGILNHLKRNWGKYAAGAGAAMLADHFSDTVHDFNDDMHRHANSVGEYWNHAVDKLKVGDQTAGSDSASVIKSGGGNYEDIAKPEEATKQKFKQIVMSSKTNNDDIQSKDFKPKQEVKPNISKLKSIISKSDDSTATPDLKQPKPVESLPSPTQPQSYGEFYKYLVNNPEIINKQSGSTSFFDLFGKDTTGYNPLLQNNEAGFMDMKLFGKDPEEFIKTKTGTWQDVPDEMALKIQGELSSKAFKQWQEDQARIAAESEAAQKQAALLAQKALQDGKIDPTEKSKILAILGKIKKPDDLFDRSDFVKYAKEINPNIPSTTDNMGDEDLSYWKQAALPELNKKYQRIVDFIKSNNLNMFMDKNIDDDFEELSKMKGQGIPLPKELEDYYQILKAKKGIK